MHCGQSLPYISDLMRLSPCYYHFSRAEKRQAWLLLLSLSNEKYQRKAQLTSLVAWPGHNTCASIRPCVSGPSYWLRSCQSSTRQMPKGGMAGAERSDPRDLVPALTLLLLANVEYCPLERWSSPNFHVRFYWESMHSFLFVFVLVHHCTLSTLD